MNNIIKYSVFLALFISFWACEKDKTYPGAVIYPYLPMYDLRSIYHGKDVPLSKETMFGCDKITGVVVSDHTGGNMPAGLLIMQDYRRLNLLRGIAIELGNDAATFVPGDSLIVNLAGKVMTKKEGILRITGVTTGDITKVSSNNTIPAVRANSSQILANPDAYESVLSVLVKGGFNPLPAPTDKFGGKDWVLNDGFGNITVSTTAGATFADSLLPVMANYRGIVFNKEGSDGKSVPIFRLRTGKDYDILSSVIELQPILITGFCSDPRIASDGNYEYVQMMATRDIDFAVTPYSLVWNNNAGASNPTGAPNKGWATGVDRTYKININSGTAAKGTFFYVGGKFKLINGDLSTDISSVNWVKNYDYVTKAGEGFGVAKNGWLANSGNAFGIAVFEGVTVTADTKPVDVIWVNGGGSLYSAGPPPLGYKIANTDWYDVVNPLEPSIQQPYFRMGTNNTFLAYNTGDLGFFYILGGEYNVGLGRWTKARTQTNVLMTKTSQLSEIQNDSLSTKLFIQ
ncbi:DUF5689 domain-containing protein [uncultured Chitinophaga sp.]|uniref:DUF5689 domain-containing protein n=1 Tax=uncultured Chitinophaga sp. TaxID=339340 RepID=UPI0025D856D9|nr:DUF5689 domain-containing protein [uncultured Chitinophaga sp.]